MRHQWEDIEYLNKQTKQESNNLFIVIATILALFHQDFCFSYHFQVHEIFKQKKPNLTNRRPLFVFHQNTGMIRDHSIFQTVYQLLLNYRFGRCGLSVTILPPWSGWPVLAPQGFFPIDACLWEGRKRIGKEGKLNGVQLTLVTLCRAIAVPGLLQNFSDNPGYLEN